MTASTALNAVHETTLLVSRITNSVVTNFTMNTLLVVGAAPTMVDIISGAGPFASITSVLPINLRALTLEQREAARQAMQAAHDADAPWVLGPVAVGALVYHTALVHKLLDSKPTVIRGSTSEIIALVNAGIGDRGVDAVDEVDTAPDAARTLTQEAEYVVAISGTAGAIVSASEILRVGGGAKMLTRVTGGGRALGAVSAALVSAGRTKGLEDLESVAACHIAYLTAIEHTES